MMLLEVKPMFVPLLLMMIVAPLGAIDLIYYHGFKFKLYDRKDSYLETVIHLIRGLLFSSGAFILLNYQPNGIWFWATGAIFVLDLANSIFDVSIEGRSRKTLGGIPTLEYIIHTIGSTFAGAITISYFILGWHFRLIPTSLSPLADGTYSKMFLGNGFALVIGGIILTTIEAILLCKSIIKYRSESH